MDGEILYREECYQIQGAVFEVYREMGCGFLEAVYQECLGKELLKRGIPFVTQQELRLCYKGEPLRQTYIPDFICHESIILEGTSNNWLFGLRKRVPMIFLWRSTMCAYF
ncbi:MAG: hypothetical protein FD173_804 [Gallionellaceae bacterium]|nr:MAG: hypothetical protein FD173_804 [Gallionellaceae bacterium]